MDDTPTDKASKGSSSSVLGPALGGALGGVAVLMLLATGLFVYKRHLLKSKVGCLVACVCTELHRVGCTVQRASVACSPYVQVVAKNNYATKKPENPNPNPNHAV